MSVGVVLCEWKGCGGKVGGTMLSEYNKHNATSKHYMYCTKPCKMKVPNCALFSVAHRVCYIFPWKIQYRKYCSIYIAINQLKYRSECTTGNIARERGLEAKYSTWLCLVLY